MRLPRTISRASALPLIAWAVLVAGLAAAALGASGSGSPELRAVTDGDLTISDSRGEQAIVSASNLYPGGETFGEVTIANDGSAPGTLSLAASDPTDPGAANSALLAQNLQLTFAEVTPGSEGTVLAGPFASMPAIDLGDLAPGESRDFRFTVVFPDSGGPENDWSGDNVYQHLATSIDFEWTLTGTEDGGGGGGGGGGTGGDGGGSVVQPAPSSGCHSVLRGGAKSDRLVGTPVGDYITGGGGADLILGHNGNDCLHGQGGRDHVVGGAGNDFIAGEADPDVMHGGPGDDVIVATRGGRDTIDCGTGKDWVLRDSRDRVKRC